MLGINVLNCGGTKVYGDKDEATSWIAWAYFAVPPELAAEAASDLANRDFDSDAITEVLNMSFDFGPFAPYSGCGDRPGQRFAGLPYLCFHGNNAIVRQNQGYDV